MVKGSRAQRTVSAIEAEFTEHWESAGRERLRSGIAEAVSAYRQAFGMKKRGRRPDKMKFVYHPINYASLSETGKERCIDALMIIIGRTDLVRDATIRTRLLEAESNREAEKLHA